MKKQDRLHNRLSWKLTVTWMLVLLLILSACGAGAPQPTPESTATPTAVPATETATAVPTPEAAFSAGGGTYDDAQQKMVDAFLENGPDVPAKMREWGRAFIGYLKYWVGSNKVSADLLKNVPIQWFWDESDPHNPDKVTACIDIAAFGGDCFSVPIVNGEPQMAPPAEYVNGGNEAGQEPLPITKSGAYEDGSQYFTGSENGKWVRRDKPTNEKGRVVERLSEGGQWPSEVARSLGYPYMPYSRIEGGKLIDLNGTVWAHQDENKKWVGEFVHHETMWGLPDVYTKDIYTKTLDMSTVSEDKIPPIRSMPVTKNEHVDAISIADLFLTQIDMNEVVAKGKFSTYVAELTFMFKIGTETHKVTFEVVEALGEDRFQPDNFPLVLGQCYQPVLLTPNRDLEPGEFYKSINWGSDPKIRGMVLGNGSWVKASDLIHGIRSNWVSSFSADSVLFVAATPPAGCK